MRVTLAQRNHIIGETRFLDTRNGPDRLEVFRRGQAVDRVGSEHEDGVITERVSGSFEQHLARFGVAR